MIYTRNMSNEWDPERALASLTSEAQIFGLEPHQQAQKIFAENAASAAMVIVHTARYGENERVRLQAAEYVVERTLGPVGSGTAEEAPWEALLARCVVSVQQRGAEE